MNVNFFVTCIGDALKSRMARDSVLLLEQLGCRVHFPERQGCCGQPAINSGYIRDALPGMKTLIATLEENDDPIISPAGSCTNAIRHYADWLVDEPAWASRAERVAGRMVDLTSFIVNRLGVTDVGAHLPGKAVYHPSCSLFRKMGVRDEPLALLRQVRGLELLPLHAQETCCGFGGTFSVKMAEISGEMVKEKVAHIMEAKPDYLIGADVSCLINIGGRLRREGHAVQVLHIAEVLMSR
ncbi:(Fe-S)-binding protein [Dickeya dadantii]|uniref:(Fe-S)-binding protein n=1 Tax=Dickeya dadantii TaxID=204038 RepID=UPI001495FFE7|nr:(Fe-S)-binding protein [Dickeya dadantii]MCL6408122.1 (Fe-S)-binding protein [Dickeya dadantii]NPE50545.1 (Fe-S)-binding protein [Dickeya dadantii]NPE56318.1 (Fe-S)-binding protein [Dickeya dadantii]NPE66625.1 (Fe-S)-binding protein [Dickeya dadantii]